MTRIVWIYESEVRAIAQEAFSWQVETGGDLFGFWEPEPVVMLATRGGPNVERQLGTHRFDLNYLSSLSIRLHVDWGLFYFGDWHSHPLNRLIYSPPEDYHRPSMVDQKRIRQVARRNQFSRMIEFITTPNWHGDGSPESIYLHPYLYQGARDDEPDEMGIRVLPEISPVREALISRDALPEQRLSKFNSAASGTIPCLQTTNSPAADFQSHLREMIRRQLLKQAALNVGTTFQEPNSD